MVSTADYSKAADQLRKVTSEARQEAELARKQSEESKSEAEVARRSLELARKQVEELKSEAEAGRKSLEEAKSAAEASKKRSEELEQALKLSEAQSEKIMEASTKLLELFPGETTGAGLVSDLQALPGRILQFVKGKAADAAGYTLARVKANYRKIDFEAIRAGFPRRSTQDEVDNYYTEAQEAVKAIVSDLD
jgi:membrane protein involved in colicin uptake